MNDKTNRTVGAHFETVFGACHEAIGEAPGRVNLIGEHIDYNGGLVLPTALTRSVQVAVGSSRTSEDQIYSSRYDEIARRQIGEAKSGDWSDYAVGALAKARGLGHIHGPVNLAVTSKLPSGAGVSSSAALVTAILRAACRVSGSEMAPIEIGKAARAVENEYIGVPRGIMDQMAVGLAVPDQALAIDTAKDDHESITIPDGFAVVTMHTGIHRELSDGRYKRRIEECETARRILKVEHFCSMDESEVNRLPEPLQSRARHMVSEHGRTCQARDARKAGNMELFGTLMNDSHTSYSTDFDASTPEIDALVRSVCELGATGGRLTGGGFGGCIVALLKPEAVREWTNAVMTRHPSAWLV